VMCRVLSAAGRFTLLSSSFGGEPGLRGMLIVCKAPDLVVMVFFPPLFGEIGLPPVGFMMKS
jgi:hypothetical protein